MAFRGCTERQQSTGSQYEPWTSASPLEASETTDINTVSCSSCDHRHGHVVSWGAMKLSMTCVASGCCVDQGCHRRPTMLMSVICDAAGGPVNVVEKRLWSPLFCILTKRWEKPQTKQNKKQNQKLKTKRKQKTQYTSQPQDGSTASVNILEAKKRKPFQSCCQFCVTRLWQLLPIITQGKY